MKSATLILIIGAFAALSSAFTGDDKFLRKYAMMKVYEACFGQDVVKEVRMEMKAAASKCAGMVAPQPSKNPINIHGSSIDSFTQHKNSQLQQHSQESLSSPQGQESAPQAAALHSHAPNHEPPKTTTLDLNKLQQAILAGYTKHNAQQQPQSFASPQHQPVFMPQPQPPQQPYRPYYQQPSHSGMYYSPNVYPPQLPQPYVPTPYYHSPVYQPPFHPMPSYYSGRSSRDLDIRGQLETLSNSMTGKIRNVTCVMQELGYLTGNLEPDYGRMIERIGRLPVSEDLKKDMVEGVDFCRQFSQCVPDDRKDKLIREMVRPMFFFRCYKHKKLEACIMKDVRERYNQNDDLSEDNLTSSDERRSGKEFPEDNMATAIYEFLYGGDRIDIDTLL
ncbi:uncharacterized protein [Rhodnius prolixus]|uniref:Uncharacterized protein n=1 Tax=Rhodnius prolixus TaxID=13249 RepID=T1HCZ0_RHOPR